MKYSINKHFFKNRVSNSLNCIFCIQHASPYKTPKSVNGKLALHKLQEAGDAIFDFQLHNNIKQQDILNRERSFSVEMVGLVKALQVQVEENDREVIDLKNDLEEKTKLLNNYDLFYNKHAAN